MEINTKIATVKTVISTIGSVAAGAMVARTIINDFLPHEIHDFLFSSVRSFLSRYFSNELTLIINEYDSGTLETNEIFKATELCLGTLAQSSLSYTSSSAHCLRVTKPESEKSIRVTVDRNEEMVDEFEGVKFTWVLRCHHVEERNGKKKSRGREVRAYYLTFHKDNKGLALDKYLPYVLDRAALFKQENKTTKLYTIDFLGHGLYGSVPTDSWISVRLNHPSTFDTLALDLELKNRIIDDLDRFVKRKEYYRRVGKAWKRGYLLYGPPGTGKSSLIAAMANYLNFDIYDLELSAVKSDSDLRKILMGTGNQSIVVMEDIDCSVEFNDRESDKNTEGKSKSNNNNNNRHVTLSGFLNIIDGLWSSCGNERIIIFTTNHKEKLDPALLRPGRMDMHIHMSYCTASGFKVLARNYLGLNGDNTHEVFREIEMLIGKAQVTPAEVAERLIKHDEPNAALRGLLDFFKLKVSEKALDGTSK